MCYSARNQLIRHDENHLDDPKEAAQPQIAEVPQTYQHVHIMNAEGQIEEEIKHPEPNFNAV